jgi:hypothetical protein
LASCSQTSASSSITLAARVISQLATSAQQHHGTQRTVAALQLAPVAQQKRAQRPLPRARPAPREPRRVPAEPLTATADTAPRPRCLEWTGRPVFSAFALQASPRAVRASRRKTHLRDELREQEHGKRCQFQPCAHVRASHTNRAISTLANARRPSEATDQRHAACRTAATSSPAAAWRWQTPWASGCDRPAAAVRCALPSVAWRVAATPPREPPQVRRAPKALCGGHV